MLQKKRTLLLVILIQIVLSCGNKVHNNLKKTRRNNQHKMQRRCFNAPEKCPIKIRTKKYNR